jgi:tetraacyldisaccharide 4'-kinase
MSAPSSIVLAPLSVLYDAVTRTRLALYRRGLLNVSKLAAPVISVGNMTTGGTGKTPLVEWVARALAREGRKVCILTRGYGRQNPGARIIVSDGQRILADQVAAGDEPFLLAENLLGLAAVISDADRFAAGAWAIEELASDAFILDDGFQHLRVARNLDIVTIDATSPWGGRRLLPYGRLREPLRGLARADCVVITRADQANDLDSLKTEIGRLSANRPIFTSRMKARSLRRLEDQLSEGAAISDRTIEGPNAAFCAIGNPNQFLRQLRDDGFNLCVTRAFPDHHRYNQADADALVEEANRAGAKSLITTAKDAVKLRALRFDLPCYIMAIEIAIEREDKFLELIRAALAMRQD